MLNPFFLQGSKTEQGLVQDLINEQLKMYGVDIYYLPRFYVTKKTVIKEVIESRFDFAYPLEAYVDSFEGYEGAGTLLTKFGVQPFNDLTLIISKERYQNYITPLIENLEYVELATRPKEGDLIYFPLGDRLFEIKFVEHEIPFYQLQANYVYTLRCELFRYEDELIDTGIDFIDDNVQNEGYSITLNMVGIGVTATAITSIVNGGVRKVVVTNRGDGYKSAPSVGFSSSPDGSLNSTATGIANMIGGIVDFCEVDSSLLRVQSVELTNSGFGYTVSPNVAFYGGGGSGAKAYSIIGDGIVGIITVTNGGSGYIEAPPVTFVGVSSIGAAGTTIIENGSVTQIRILDSGLNYIESPQIVIGSPYMVGVGTYAYNETIIGSVTGTIARVKSWNAQTNQLRVSNLSGNFMPGETIIGQDSNASYKLKYTGDNTIDYVGTGTTIIKNNDSFADNLNIEIEADKILDFSERNPFGSP